ncbi:MAG: hypothetical protein AAGD43_01155 [Pseudomonadota bacterium]
MRRQTFDLDGYCKLLRSLLSRGYEVVDFHTLDPQRQHLILRHDIDMSIAAAQRVAEVEAELGLRSIYFVLLRTELYNVWSDIGRKQLKHIAELGHEVGLHLDLSLYDDTEKAIENAARSECDALELVTEKPVRTISFHRPAKALQGRPGKLAGRRHAYEPTFFSEIGYCSDSRGGWHYGHPLEHPSVRDRKALQLLTHPIWWQSPAMAPEDRLCSFLREKFVLLDLELANNCSTHKQLTNVTAEASVDQ